MEILFPFLIARLVSEFKLGVSRATKDLLGGTAGWGIPCTTARGTLVAWLASVRRILDYEGKFEPNVFSSPLWCFAFLSSVSCSVPSTLEVAPVTDQRPSCAAVTDLNRG